MGYLEDRIEAMSVRMDELEAKGDQITAEELGEMIAMSREAEAIENEFTRLQRKSLARMQESMAQLRKLQD